ARIDALVGEMDRMTLDFLEEHAYAPRSGAIDSTHGDSIKGRDGGNGAAPTEAPARDVAISVIGELEAS
ncbi:MAG: hypothetical protein KDA33_06635, partial [Phycisphaerales bacterium]|nr:hypothetical protein [Phycisphaerales bacterium]